MDIIKTTHLYLKHTYANKQNVHPIGRTFMFINNMFIVFLQYSHVPCNLHVFIFIHCLYLNYSLKIILHNTVHNCS